MHRIAVIGDNDSIIGFKALGLTTFPVVGRDDALEALKRVYCDPEYAIILITENMGEHIMDEVKDLSKGALPAIIFIPGNQGSLGIGMMKLKDIVEKAVGVDILFGKEGRK